MDRYTSTIKFVDSHTLHQQQLFQQQQQFTFQQHILSAQPPSALIKSEVESHSIIRDSSNSNSSSSSSFNNISNFKNLQRNLEMIERQDMMVRQETMPYEDSDGSDINDLPESQDSMNEPPSQLLNNDNEQDDDLEEEDEEDDIILSPMEWNVDDVTEFLIKHDCQEYCELFAKNQVDGRKLMQFTQQDIVQLLGNKLGPAVKIYELIKSMKATVTGMRNF